VITIEPHIAPKQTILIVEDSPEDYEATRRAFRKCGLKNPIHHSSDGEGALDFLFRRGEFSDPKKAPRPALILLDLNLPGTDGHEVLAVVKQDEALRMIPVIVLTTSSKESDIEECYNAGVNSYMVKPVNRGGFMDAIQRLTDFWF
jgi:CheY-like chemotaxis protein